MSADLAVQQTAMLDLLHSDAMKSGAFFADMERAKACFSFENQAVALRGWRAYRSHAQALAVSSLRAAYPTLFQLLGEDNFSHLAQDFWQVQPPQRGDLAQWGGALSDYMPALPPLRGLLAEHPYLCDVARLEWALHTAQTATDAVVDADRFHWLSTYDPAQLQLGFSAGCILLRSAYPVVAVLHWHDPHDEVQREVARQCIAQQQAQTALVWRQGFRPMLASVDAGAAALIEATLQGLPLSAAMEAAFEAQADFDFGAWLAHSVQSGLLVTVNAMPASD